MRGLADSDRLRRFFEQLAQAADGPADVYVTGGATAVLFGWRKSTIDADIVMVPEQDSLYRALPRLKEELRINVEIASPAHFIPELAGWRDRRILIETHAPVSFYHYDPYSQALAKIERGHAKDLSDVGELIRRRLVRPDRLRELFDAIQPRMHRYPAIDPASFRRKLDAALREWS